MISGVMIPYRPPSDGRCCHACGTQDGMICYPDTPALAYCPDCCPDHEYSYASGDGWTCGTCGAESPDDWFICDSDIYDG